MENTPNQLIDSKQKIVVLRWGHRIHRDSRLTTHCALTSRAMCASGFILADIEDKSIEKTIKAITKHWGGNFVFEMGTNWRNVVRDWKAKGGIVAHLTAYGENIQSSDVLNRIRETGKDILLLVGSQKVPGEFYSTDVSDFNIGVGNQPHSECSALAIFLDRFFEGKELMVEFEKAEVKIIPQKHGKNIEVNEEKA
ncbi:MAG: tRNA (cytidine(56)-2'-O)-methyltransferase [Nitrososphaerota archaeon]|jgi:tRNA (cytidine56-2'-O)-methyltransferase|uniref:tRNA (cytidine(56)-2'-O)-methyltransferase n=1 Tax=Candidatus Bathycorpusculum sp. TaxID=2994959 RepID=UPI00281CCECD|nr:tRNA (cytidine(56)-2'-O)-methyltransferase [Candidatus Termiticorpusculum sp.]MCL2257597.1 tRNA (cytidine(56)-2'-O)-methyltransferase [Candidatus Termiticorpusculum sp.]MCL2292254.1 tRNA (cytidine(56)-2'-O)-methyltransferase [Candidatus Termiticorpusculum sp.]MDR0460449.1 tRNA (cytidine(56)-2'-O)-methyltransferase [Nitrososphaerota archaeon]